MRRNQILLAICTISLLITSLQSLAQPSNRTSVPENIKLSSGTYMTQQAHIISLSPSQNVLTLNDSSAVQPNKKENDWSVIIATVVSTLSLVISFAVAYTSNLRPANIQLCFGRNIILFPILIDIPTSSGTMAGTGFNLPITFNNWSPQGGTIQRMRLVVRKHDRDDCYDMTWTTFVKIGSGGNFEDESLAQPISIKGVSSVSKIIRFDWTTAQGGTKFDVEAGNYDLSIYGWTKNTQKPSLAYTQSFKIQDNDYEIFKDSVAANLVRSIWVSLNENEKPNQCLSKNNIDRLYSK